MMRMVTFLLKFQLNVKLIFFLINVEETDMIDEQKCAQLYLREVKKQNFSTIDARFDNLVERL
jgi:hypothetical protein